MAIAPPMNRRRLGCSDVEVGDIVASRNVPLKQKLSGGETTQFDRTPAAPLLKSLLLLSDIRPLASLGSSGEVERPLLTENSFDNAATLDITFLL